MEKIMCLYPTYRKNRKYTITKKNRGIIPECRDERMKAMPTKCRKCKECLDQKGKEWQIRLKEDIKKHKNGIFVTLTFSNENITKLLKEIGTYKGYETDNELARIAVKRFLGRWKKEFGGEPRHWLITELGHKGTENIHLHGILYTSQTTKNETIRQVIARKWEYGYIYPRYEHDVNYVSNKTINYITKYITKIDKDHKHYTPKMFPSKGIGLNYTTGRNAETNKYKPNKTKEYYTNEKGFKQALPIYWRNKIYTEEERENLWIEKLDKGTRYVCGEKIEGTEEEYYKALKYHRQRTKKLGYNDDQKNWTQKQYENDRRKYNIQKRTNATETKKLLENKTTINLNKIKWTKK